MEGILLILRLVLGTTFLVAALTKLNDGNGARRMLTAFGLSPALSSSGAIILPLAELVVGLALIPSKSAFWGAIGATFLICLFIAAISVNLARGRRPECRCFGQVSSGPIGPRTLFRNAVLLSIAILIAARGPSGTGTDVWAWWKVLDTAQRWEVLFVVCVLAGLTAEAWLLLHVLRQSGRLLVRIEALESVGRSTQAAFGAPNPGLPIGLLAPEFELPDRTGALVTLKTLRAAGKSLILIFSDPDCPTCEALAPLLAQWQRAHAMAVAIAVISRRRSKGNSNRILEASSIPLLLQQDHEIADVYGCAQFPGAVLISANGLINSSLAMGISAIHELVSIVLDGEEPAANAQVARTEFGDNGTPHKQGLQVGEKPAGIYAIDLRGDRRTLSDFRGNAVVLVFWNPSCVYCAQMERDLKLWEQETDGDPTLVLISAGSVEQNLRIGVKAPILLDPGAVFSRAFGVRGTPSAVLLDDEGNVASGVAVGSNAVLALARASTPGGSPR